MTKNENDNQTPGEVLEAWQGICREYNYGLGGYVHEELEEMLCTLLSRLAPRVTGEFWNNGIYLMIGPKQKFRESKPVWTATTYKEACDQATRLNALLSSAAPERVGVSAETVLPSDTEPEPPPPFTFRQFSDTSMECCLCSYHVHQDKEGVFDMRHNCDGWELEDPRKPGCTPATGYTEEEEDIQTARRKARSASPSGSVCCYDCGRPYESFDLDVLVTNAQWKQICPKPYDGAGGGGILCPNCIVKRGSKLPGITVARIYFEE